MSTERYVGERRALWHFLAELHPLIVIHLGDDALLHHRIDKALKTGDLDQLRDARRMFHHWPDDLKRRLMRGIFDSSKADGQGGDGATRDQAPAGTPASASPSTLDSRGSRTPTTIRFSAFPAARDEDIALSVDLDDDKADGAAGSDQAERPNGDAPVQVMIEAGTLPRSAAETLRQIATWIEHDRRLLSTQHWVHADRRSGLSGETLDQA